MQDSEVPGYIYIYITVEFDAFETCFLDCLNQIYDIFFKFVQVLDSDLNLL